MSNFYDEMIATNIDAPSPPSEPPAAPLPAAPRPGQATNITAAAPTEATAAPLAVPRPQQAISAVSVVQPEKTPAIITTATPMQAAPPPKTAGGNLVPQGSTTEPAPAVQMAQTQGAPQTLTPVSWLKTGA